MPFKFNSPDGSSFDEEALLNGTVADLKQQVAAKCAVHSEFAYLLELRFNGQRLEPEGQSVRQFTELCPVRAAAAKAAD